MEVDLDKIKCSDFESFYVAKVDDEERIIFRDRRTELPVEKIIALSKYNSNTCEIDYEQIIITDVFKLHYRSQAFSEIDQIILNYEEKRTKWFKEKYTSMNLVYRYNFWLIDIDNSCEATEIMTIFLDNEKVKKLII